MCKGLGFRVKSKKLDLQIILEQVQEFAKANDVVVQLFNAELIYGIDHLLSACNHAKRALTQGRAISDSLSMEILLYGAGEYQIKNALGKVGVKQNTSKIALVIVGAQKSSEQIIDDLLVVLKSKGIELERDDDVLIGDKMTLERFGIPKEELTAVPEDRWFELVLEKVALLDIQK